MKNALSYSKAKFGQIGYCIFFIAFFIPGILSAQTRGTVQVIKDPLIDTLIARRAAIGKTVTAGDENSNGYRVQIFFGSSRQAAYDAQEKFKEEYPEYRTYLSYIEPNFKVQVGDFRTKLEAQKLMNQLTQMFTSLFVMPGKINPPKPDTPND